jgi:isocitrate dehydrogenase
MLSGVMMFRHLGWSEAADLIEQGIGTSIGQKQVTYDLARLMQDATELKTSQFAAAIIENMHAEVRA